MTTNPVPVLSDDEVAKVEARRARCLDNRDQSRLAEASILIASDIPALCATVRALRVELERTPLAQSVLRQLDELRAANQRATETNTALREQLAEAQDSLIAVRNCQNLHCGHCAALLRATLEKQL